MPVAEHDMQCNSNKTFISHVKSHGIVYALKIIDVYCGRGKWSIICGIL